MKDIINALKKNVISKITKLDVAMAIGLVFAITVSSFTSFAKYCELKQDEILRLHIIANSDSDEDQGLKYEIRDELLGEFSQDVSSAKSIDEAKELARQNLEKYKQIATEYAQSKGFYYPVNVELVNMYFTTRVYESYTLPAGNYDALRVILGSGEGRNWWCIMYPMLCVPAVSETSEDNSDENKTTDNTDNANDSDENADDDVITLTESASKNIEESKEIEFKFAIFEFFKGWFS